MRPFSPYYVPYNWRGFFDFGTGQIGNWGIHTMGPVHLALQLNAPTSVELISQESKSRYTYPYRAVIRFEFPARGGMPPVTIYWHDSPRPGDPEAYRVPGMENETILPRPNNLAEQGPLDGRPRRACPPRRRPQREATPPRPLPVHGSGREVPVWRSLKFPGVAAEARSRVFSPAMERSSSAPKASWPPAIAVKASTCFPRRDGRNTSSLRRC